MGFARRVVRKTVRKATPRPVRRAMHPVRTARYAVTPRPVRQMSRAAYTVTNPLGAAENALIGAALNAGSSRRGSSSSRSRGSRTRTAAGHGSDGMTASELRVAEGVASHDHLALLMAVQQERFAPARRPVLPAPAPVDPRPYFTEEWARRKGEARLWQRIRRKELRVEAQTDAQARADEHLAQAQAAYAVEQQRADAWWAALNDGDAQVVRGVLHAAFADNPAPVTVLTAAGTEASLVVWLPGLDVLPDRKAHITPSGRLSSKAWTKTERNDVYAELLGAHLLATLRETWAVAPSVTRTRVAGVARADGAADQVVFDVTCERAARGWDDDRLGGHLLETEGGLQRAGRTREVRGWPPGKIAADVKSLLHQA